jgi:FkbM family methyltransferase
VFQRIVDVVIRRRQPDDEVQTALAALARRVESLASASHENLEHLGEAVDGLRTRLDSLVEFSSMLAADRSRLAPGELATPEDIWACFRLLLRREPSPAEWIGHSSHAGLPIDDVVTEFLTSLEFKLGHADLLRPDLDLLEIDGRKMYVYADDAGISSMLRAGPYEPDVTAFVRSRLRPGDTFLDLGANLGHFSLLAAAEVGDGRVIAVEASSRNVVALRASIRENQLTNVQVLNVAASSAWQLLAFAASGTNGMTMRSDPADTHVEVVQGVPLDDALEIDRLDLVKIDVEGAEFLALSGLRSHLTRFMPTIVSEFAPPALEEVSGVTAETYLEFLFELGYSAAVLNRDGTPGEPVDDAEPVLRAFAASGFDHIDVVFEPRRTPDG